MSYVSECEKAAWILDYNCSSHSSIVKGQSKFKIISRLPWVSSSKMDVNIVVL